MPKITPFLWYDTQAEEAAKFYCSVIKNSKIHKTARCAVSVARSVSIVAGVSVRRITVSPSFHVTA